MPTVSWFYGIAVRLFFNDHAPAHFHAFYGNHEARVAIATGELLSGYLPARQRRLVRKWTLLYREQLLLGWSDARAGRMPERIPGLDAANDD